MAIRDLQKRIFACALLIAAVFTILQAIDYRQDVPSNDTYQYAKQTLRILGESQGQSVHDATVMYCQDSGNAAATAESLNYAASSTTSSYNSAYEACLHTYRNGLTPSSPRYLAIFTSRPGYPLIAAPFAAVFGLRFGLWAAAILCTLLASFLVIMILREAGSSVPIALAGQALFLVAPTGYWGSRMLTDGPSIATALLALLGAYYMTKQQVRKGAIVLTAGMVTGFLIRYSSEQAFALALALAAVVCLLWVRGARTRGMKALAIVAGGGFVVSEIASTVLGWPGISESLQDTFTKHFVRPDVSNPISRLVSLDLHFWGYYPVLDPTALLLAAGLIVIGILLVRRDAVYGTLVIATAATGLAAVAAHPLASQAERLMMPVWLLLVLGLPRLLPSRDPKPEEGAENHEPTLVPENA